MKGLLEYAKKTSPGRTRMDLQTRNLRSKVHPSKGHRRADAEPKLEEELEKGMEDFQIIDLYWKRDESAISETAKNMELSALESPEISCHVRRTPKNASATPTIRHGNPCRPRGRKSSAPEPHHRDGSVLLRNLPGVMSHDGSTDYASVTLPEMTFRAQETPGTLTWSCPRKSLLLDARRPGGKNAPAAAQTHSKDR